MKKISGIRYILFVSFLVIPIVTQAQDEAIALENKARRTAFNASVSGSVGLANFYLANKVLKCPYIDDRLSLFVLLGGGAAGVLGAYFGADEWVDLKNKLSQIQKK